MRVIFHIILDNMKYLYIEAYNIFFSGWRYMGDGHYHFFPPKEHNYDKEQ